MQHDASTEQFQFVSHTQRLVNDVVVEHQMNTFRPPVGAAQKVEKLAEHGRVLALGYPINNTTRACVQGAKDIAFDVFPRRQYHRLLARLEIGLADFWVQVKVGLILIEHLIVRRCLRDDFLYVFQYLAAPANGNTQQW